MTTTIWENAETDLGFDALMAWNADASAMYVIVERASGYEVRIYEANAYNEFVLERANSHWRSIKSKNSTRYGRGRYGDPAILKSYNGKPFPTLSGAKTWANKIRKERNEEFGTW